jgi:hypothetical protein
MPPPAVERLWKSVGRSCTLRLMRRSLALLAVTAAVVLAGTASAQTDRADDRGLCNSKGVDIYFWPQGHPAIPAIGFPAFAPTHTEIYKPHDVSSTGALGYLDPAQSGLSGNQCSGITDAPLTIAAGTPTQTTTATQKLRCTFAANAEIRLGKWTQVKTHVVTRTIKVKGKRKKVRRLIRTTVQLGNLGSVGVTGATAAAAEVRMSPVSGKSSLKWNPAACTSVDVAG